MYNPAHFEETDLTTLHNAIEEIGLGALIVAEPGGLEANHLPFEVDRTVKPLGVLRCHVARNNNVWRVKTNSECLVIFQGPSAYISPNLYASKKEHGKVVPTYNYVAVHAHGRIVIHDDEKWVRGLVGRLTNKFEASQPKPWTMGDAPYDFIEQRLKEIVGIEIEITRLEGKWKMSQNRPEVDRVSVTMGLRESPDPAAARVAEIVEKRKP